MKLKGLFLSVAVFVTVFIILCFNKSNNTEYSRLSSSTFSNTTSDLTIFIASDLHFLSPKLTDNGVAFQKFHKNGDGKQLDYISSIIDTLIYDVKTKKPSALLLSGDLTLNGEKDSHIELASRLSELKNLGIPVFVIPGNHDINNPWARGFKNDKQYVVDTISDKEFSEIYSTLGYESPISKDKHSLSYLAELSQNVWLLMIDDNNYHNNLSLNYPAPNGSVSKETLKWISDCGKLAQKNGAKIMAISHHNLINHSEYIWENYTLDNNEKVLEVFNDANINMAFSGHIHLQSIKNYNNGDFSIYDISNASLAVYPQKYGVLNISYDYAMQKNKLNYHTALLDIKNYSNSIATSDFNLTNFDELSRNFYSNFIYTQNFNGFSKIKGFNSNDVNEICETIKNIRLKYDSNLDNITWSDITTSKGFYLLKQIDSIYAQHYVKLATDANEFDNNNLQLLW